MKKILVIDDDQQLQNLLSRKFSGKNIQVLTAADGLTGLALARQHRPDLVIMDIIMPKMTGYDLCKSLRDNAETRDIPILVLSGQGDISNHFKSLQCGANDFVTKPIDLNSLVEKIHQTAPLLLQEDAD